MAKMLRRGWAVGDAPNGWPVAEGGGGGASGSALLAMRTHHAVQRYVCLACLRQARALTTHMGPTATLPACGGSIDALHA